LYKTLLHDWHAVKGATFTEFAGFHMPLFYEGISREHMAVRENVGLFDVSHMGRILVQGKDAVHMLDFLTVNDPVKLKNGRVQYTCMCNEKGGIIDDMTLYKFSEEFLLVVCNAANREKVLKHMLTHKEGGGFSCTVEDVTLRSLMLAVQGPESPKVVEDFIGSEAAATKRWRISQVNDLILSRTGYTGEDGFELVLLNADEKRATKLTEELLSSGAKYGLQLCGLGARDTLRIEAGLPLYGNELNEDITPYEARIDFIVKLNKGTDFLGKGILAEQASKGVSRIRIGFVAERGIPRKGYAIEVNGNEVGHVTSGTFSPLLKKGIGMGYVHKEYDVEGLEIYIKARGRKMIARVKMWPFYDPAKYGFRRGRGELRS